MRVRLKKEGLKLAISVALLAPLTAFKATPHSAEITVTGKDYSFSGLPATLPAGQTFFAFKNDGKVRHELSVARLKPGVSPEDAIAAIKTGGRRRDYIEGAAVLIVAGPGEESGRARIVIDLKKGETYVVVCTLKDKPEMPPHVMFGMYASFRVE